jgi:hypothetical protein
MLLKICCDSSDDGQALSLCDALLALDPEEGTLDDTLNTVIWSEFKKFT